MRPRSVYAKLLVGFGAVLVLTVSLAALWSWWLFRGPSSSEGLFEAEAQARLVRLALSEAAAAAPDKAPADNPRLARALREVAAAGRARLWLEGPHGAVLLKSFAGPPLGYVVRAEPASSVITLLEPKGGEHGVDYFFRTPVDLAPWGKATLYAAFDEYRFPGRAEAWFVPGLAAIALLVAVLVVPVSRFITSPLRQLQDVVTGYAGGDLGRRYGGRREDEIGDLGRAFNAMADSLERMITGSRELVANVSHELRSPMARMRVSAELLGDDLERDARDRGARDDARRHLAGIREEVEYLDRLVGRILEFSRLDLAGDGPLEVPVDLSALLEGVLERYAPAMERGNVTLRRDPGPDAARELTVPGDPTLLESALSNLVDNAVKYCPPGGQVEARCLRERGRALVRVCNTHAPLDEADLEAMFRPFHRVGTGSEPGNGLGLALVRRIAARHGGSVEAVNTALGVCVTLGLPLGPAEAS